MTFDDLAARLYTSAPDDFVKVRGEGTRALKAAGDTEAAAEFAKLAKPSVSAWAVNLLVAEHPEVIDEVVDRGSELRAAHTGGSGPAEIRAAQRARQEAIRRAAETAAELTGRPISDGHRAEIAATLEAASAEGRVADELRAGRLVRPLEAPTGFGAFGGLTVVTGGRSGADRQPAGRRRAAQDVTDTAVEDKAQQARAAMLRAEADSALEAAESAAALAAELGERVDSVEAERDRLSEEVQRLDKQLAEARRQFRDAQRSATDAARKATRAASRAERAES